MKTSTKASILQDSFFGGVHRGVPIEGYEEFVLPVIEKVLASSRHLSATSLARFANRVRPGADHRGCSKTHCAAVIAAAYCTGSRETRFTNPASEKSVDKFCRDLRFAANGWSRQYREMGDPAPVESDRDYIVARIAEIDAEVTRGGDGTLVRANALARLKQERFSLARCLSALGEGVGNYTLRLDSKQKFFTVLDALTQYVDHGKHGSLSQLDAGKSLVKELEAVLEKLS
jgi:hypothetical protein